MKTAGKEGHQGSNKMAGLREPLDLTVVDVLLLPTHEERQTSTSASKIRDTVSVRFWCKFTERMLKEILIRI